MLYMAPEHESIEAFATFLLDNDQEEFSFEAAEELAAELGVPVTGVVRGLKDFGFAMIPRASAKRVRGFQTSSHDRWFGPGSSPTHGGSGWEQIGGFGGQAG